MAHRIVGYTQAMFDLEERTCKNIDDFLDEDCFAYDDDDYDDDDYDDGYDNGYDN